jgi:hypothetical protein
MTIASRMHQKLLISAAIAAIGTLVFYATGVDWSWARETQNIGLTTLLYLITAGIGAMPYGLFAVFLVRFRPFPVFQLVFFILVVALAVSAFSWWRLHDIDTGGWDFLLVPVLQTTLMIVLSVLHGLALSLVRKRWVSGNGA